MIKSFVSLLIIILITACGTQETKPSPDSFSIVPVPAKLTAGTGTLQWSESVSIVADADGEPSAEFLSEFFSTKGVSVSESDSPYPITMKITSDSTLGQEGYTLAVNQDGVSISAQTGAGLFYGVQSLIQLISADGKQVPFVEIADAPR